MAASTPDLTFTRERAGTPQARILSGGGYKVLITDAGSGYSAYNGTTLTRWDGDPVEDPDGFRLFVRDRETYAYWALGRESVDTRQSPWEPGVFTLSQTRDGIEARLDICVAPDATAEIRRVTLTNRSGGRRWLDLTTGTEVVLHEPDHFAAHPVFSKLFLQTEYDPVRRSLLARRRPRDGHERHPWLVHTLLSESDPEFETDRARFAGRARPPQRPLAMETTAPLSGTTGNVLDPVFALRHSVTLDPDESTTVDFLLGVAPDREGALALAEAYAGDRQVADAFAGARRRATDELAGLDISAQEAEYFHALAGSMLYGDPNLRAAPGILARAHGEPVAGIRAVLHAETPAGAQLEGTLMKALRCWRQAGLAIDLVVITTGKDLGVAEVPGVRRIHAAALSPAERDLLDAAARLVVIDTLPDLAPATAGDAELRRTRRFETGTPPTLTAPSLRYFNGIGGFSRRGDEYVIRPSRSREGDLALPPQPWVNVIANENFGFLVSETGAGSTWCGNSRLHRITPWANDPLRDPHGEAFYLRDEETGEVCSCLPGPIPGAGAFEMRHGLGYSRCRRVDEGLEVRTTLFTARREPARITHLLVTNRGSRPRRLSLYAYYRLALGDRPEQSGRFVVTDIDSGSGAVYARNHMSGPFAGRVVFAAATADGGALATHAGCDRATFLGRNGDPSAPAALQGTETLDGRCGAGLDPCIAQQLIVEIPPDGSRELAFILGEEGDEETARGLAARLTQPDRWQDALREARDFWRDGVSALQIETPSEALDLMVNGWLPYQTLSCRIWGRTAFYQSGGAYGYRDQLQDTAALMPLWPDLAREQILLHAAHQYREGDVMHWWHPPHDLGLRTRFADDLLWLPYLTCDYIRTTGDSAILDRTAPYLSARLLAAGEDEILLQPEPAGETGSLYDHCCRALDRSLTRGAHGLPLFGTGDWNDGMNRVGREGRGESVWMGFFLTDILDDFAAVCEQRGDTEHAATYREHRAHLRTSLNDAGWDGAWYRRGYYDDGAPLGSHENTECRIDALVQAWSVLSGAAPADRAEQALDAVENHLISEADGLIRLLTPPFSGTQRDPGYIKGYVPGVRENGGQYTHAALWVVRAMVGLGRRDRAAALLELLNPIHHAETPEQVQVYQVEPYVVAADVYGEPPHVGRGGWTWYTGSSGWMYRVAVESVLGFSCRGGDTLIVAPCIPDEWPGYAISWHVPGDDTRYEIRVDNPDGCSAAVVSVTVDDEPFAPCDGVCRIPLARDGRTHRVEVRLGDVEGDPA